MVFVFVLPFFYLDNRSCNLYTIWLIFIFLPSSKIYTQANMPLPTKILITGCAGFIGFHLTRKAVLLGYEVIGIDNLNDYYDVSLKKARLRLLNGLPRFAFRELDLADQQAVSRLFEENAFTSVINLAAQAGVRYSLVNPHAYL